ncbi:MAG: NADH-quinone oxidoreductase subunit C [Saprospiraceae bacterium]|jgi:NADH-quinone oxidoreductase subunit C
MSPLTKEQILSYFEGNFPNNYSLSSAPSDLLTFEIPTQQLYKIVSHLFHDDELGFQFLTDICGVHYPDNTGEELVVVYHLHSMKHGTRIRLKVKAPISKPDIPTLTGLYGSANWMERETYDFYGVNFVGHPNLKRILNMDEMVEFPLRKEFPLEDPTRVDKADFQFGR